MKELSQIQGEITLSILEFGAEILSGVDDVIFCFNGWIFLFRDVDSQIHIFQKAQ